MQNVSLLSWDEIRLRGLEKETENYNLSSSVHVVQRTAKQAIPRRGLDTERARNVSKNKSARAKRTKVLFFFSKHGNLLRLRGCLSFLSVISQRQISIISHCNSLQRLPRLCSTILERRMLYYGLQFIYLTTEHIA